MIEIWKDVPQYENSYQVSNTGKIRNKQTGFIRTISKDKKGYSVVRLHENKRCKTIKLHRVLAQVFIPNPNGLSHVLHNDDNVANNSLSNLRWGTHQDNMRDKNLRQRHCTGEKHPMSKIKDADRQLIEKLLNNGYTIGQLATKFSISRTIVSRIKKRSLSKFLHHDNTYREVD